MRTRNAGPLDIGILGKTGWLADQPGDFRDRMARIGRWTALPRGASLYEVGESPEAIFGLAEGLLDVSIPIGPDEEVTVHRAPPGFWIGDGALLSGVPRLLSVRAAADCRLFRIPHGALERSLSEQPADWMYLHRLSTLNATLCMQTLAEVLALPSRARFARLLLRIALPDGTVQATQEELGRMAGMSRAAFRRALRSLIRAGALETGRGTIRIHDRAALERAAQETGG
jgi:CRP-like cAMP-binding protein